MDLKIYDKCVNQAVVDHLYDVLGKQGEFPWYFIYSTAGPKWDATELPSFVHTLFYQGQPNSDYWNLFKPFIIELFDTIGESVNTEIMRVRLGLITKMDQEYVHGPHVDWEDWPHKTALFYFNNSDGPTYFYKERWQKDVEPREYTLDQKIDPVSNRCVVFDGYQYHSSSTPVNTTYRVVMNINYF